MVWCFQETQIRNKTFWRASPFLFWAANIILEASNCSTWNPAVKNNLCFLISTTLKTPRKALKSQHHHLILGEKLKSRLGYFLLLQLSLVGLCKPRFHSLLQKTEGLREIHKGDTILHQGSFLGCSEPPFIPCTGNAHENPNLWETGFFPNIK